MTERIGKLFFKTRSFTPVPFILLIVLFAQPTRASVLLGLGFMLFGEFIRIWGVGYAGCITRTRNVGADLLVTDGPFALIRNPLYAGNFFLSLGAVVAFDAFMPWVLLAYVLLYGVQYHFIVRLEEATLLTKFGDLYRHYLDHVPRFFPNFKIYSRSSGVAFNGRVALSNERKTFVSIGVILVLSILFALFGNPFLACTGSWLSA